MIATQAHLDEIRAEIERLEALRGTPEAPPALDALLGQLRRKAQWHESRVDGPHHNTGSASLYERSGRSKRTRKRFDTARDYPVVSL